MLSQCQKLLSVTQSEFQMGICWQQDLVLLRDFSHDSDIPASWVLMGPSPPCLGPESLMHL